MLAPVRGVQQRHGSRMSLDVPSEYPSEHPADDPVRGLARGNMGPPVTGKPLRQQAKLRGRPGAVQAFQDRESLKYSNAHRRR